MINNPITGEAISGSEPLSEAEEESLLPRVIPSSWRRVPALGPAFDCVGLGDLRGVRVLFSASREPDGRKWLHVSLSRPDRIPTWEEVVAVKRIWLGDERYAYQVVPPQRDHYTSGIPGRGSNVLHLWALVDGTNLLPDFLRARGGTL